MKATLKDLEMELWLRHRSNGNIKWTTKEGKSVSIADMSDTHLVNTIKMLRRQEETEDYCDDLNELACEYSAYINDLD